MKSNKHQVEISEKWMLFAEEDYKTIEVVIESNRELNRTVCFHSQQFIEKILKGILEAKNINPPRIHDISLLVKKCRKIGIHIPLKENEIHFLSSIYIDVRYPPDVGLLPEGEPSKSDAKVALNAAKKLYEWIYEK